MRRLLGTVFLLGAFSLAGCQQSQEADDDPDAGTTVIKEETEVVPGPPAPADAPDLDVNIKTEDGSGEVKVEGNP